MLEGYEEAGTVKHETLVKSFEKYGISIALDVTEGDVLCEESGFSRDISNCESYISDDFRGSVLSRHLILHCPLVE